MLNNGPDQGSTARTQSARNVEHRPSSPVDLLTNRQRVYLRLVGQHHNSKEIAVMTGVSPRAVDKQLGKAMKALGVSSRVDAARRLVEHEAGVEPLPPANALPSARSMFPLPLPLPTAEAVANTLNWKQVAIWTVIIAIATPLAVMAAGMAIVTLQVLLGWKPL